MQIENEMKTGALIEDNFHLRIIKRRTYPSGIGSSIGILSISHIRAGAAFFPSPQKRGVTWRVALEVDKSALNAEMKSLLVHRKKHKM